ncbi:hypothetical protein P5V15_004066 [Pogonomyrmex californicus]
MSLEQHFDLHALSSRNYDGFGDFNIFGSDCYGPESFGISEDATKPKQQQQQQQQREDGLRRYQCPKCGKSYKYPGDMKKHMRFQCGQEPKFECPYCRKRTKVSSNMYAHVRGMHSDLPLYIIDLNK